MLSKLEGPRPAQPEELPQIIALANHVMRGGREPTIATDYSFIYNLENVRNVIVVKDDDIVVSMAGVWTNTTRAGDAAIQAGGINCVATSPGYRGQGLASHTMRAAVEHMAGLGCHVGRLTTEINAWYHRLGWEDTGSLFTYSLNHSNVDLLPALPHGVVVEEGTHFDDEVLDAILRLRHSDRLGGERTPQIMRELLAADNDPSLVGNKRHVLAIQDGSFVSYCLDSDHGIVEWGGDCGLVAGLVRQWFMMRVGQRAGHPATGSQQKVPDSPELALVAPAEGHPFADLLRSLSIPCRRGYWGMLYVIDPRGVLDSFGLNDINVSQSNDQFTLTRGAESIAVTRQGLAKLLFGPERTSDFARDVLPLLFWEWPLEHV